MRGVYIIVEGQTEEEFVLTSLRPYFNSLEIYDIRPILLGTTRNNKGGNLKFSRFKSNVSRLLKSEKDIIVTSLIDFFRIEKDFPQFQKSLEITDKQNRVSFLEIAMSEKINHSRFIPYIQLHEFEGLLFSDKIGIEYIPNIPQKNREKLVKIIEEFPNPELLNDGAETAPSKRLLNLIPGYKKTLHGPLIADEIGIPKIISKCPRFNAWLLQIENAIKKPIRTL